MFMPAGAVSAILGGASQAIGTGYSVAARKLSKEGQAEERQNAEDLDALKYNQFGPSKAEQESAIQDAASMARAQAQSARAENARTANARGYRAPDTTTAKLVAQGQEQVGQLRMQQSNSAAQLARQAKLDAFARVRARAQKTEEDFMGIHKAAAKGFEDAGGVGGLGGAPTTPDNLPYGKKA